MKKKISKEVIIIIVLVIIFAGVIFYYVKSDNSSSSSYNSSSKSDSTSASTDSNVSTAKATVQTIENTLSSSGEISSSLDEKLTLHAGYYFQELLVDKNVYIVEGTNIIEYTNGKYLTAPYDCVLVASELPNTEEVCTNSHYVEIQSIDSLSMNLSISESDVSKVEVGDTVDITITSTEEKFQGHITQISEVGSYSSSGSYFDAVVTFENNGNLKIGMSATCNIIIEKAENVIAVPNNAVQTSDEGTFVVVVNQDGSTSNVTIEKGISNDSYTEVKSGITENTTVQVKETEESSSRSGFDGFGGGMDSPGGFSSRSSGSSGSSKSGSSGSGSSGMPSTPPNMP